MQCSLRWGLRFGSCIVDVPCGTGLYNPALCLPMVLCNRLFLLQLLLDNTCTRSGISSTNCCHPLLPRAFSVTYWSSGCSTVDSSLWNLSSFFIAEASLTFPSIQPRDWATSFLSRFGTHPLPVTTCCDSCCRLQLHDGDHLRPLGVISFTLFSKLQV